MRLILVKSMILSLINQSVIQAALICALLLAWSGGLEAHEGQSERIERLDQRIIDQPTDPRLFLERAEMHRICRHWRSAERDYRRASELDPDLAVIDLAKATMWNDASMSAKALPLLTRYLDREPSDPRGYRELARTLRITGDLAAAAAAFTRTAELSESPAPELFAAWSDCLREAGRNAEALKVVENGIRKVGPAVSLEKRAIKLELALGLNDAALVRIDGMLALSSRKETLLLEKSHILADIGRTAEALIVVRKARGELNKQAEHRRLSGYGRQLSSQIETLETELIKEQTPENS